MLRSAQRNSTMGENELEFESTGLHRFENALRATVRLKVLKDEQHVVAFGLFMESIVNNNIEYYNSTVPVQTYCLDDIWVFTVRPAFQNVCLHLYRTHTIKHIKVKLLHIKELRV